MNDLVAPKVGALVNLNRVVVPSKAQASLSVAIRVRPILKQEAVKSGKRDIIRVLDSKVVLVLDPDESKDYLDQVQNRTKEKRYTFDIAYGATSSNKDVYQGSIADLAAGVVQGLNGTVFAYGATGSGKTHTMVGTPSDPGLMVQSLAQIFRDREALAGHEAEDFTVTCSYLEVYNELIYDLLVKSSGPLELREDPDQGVCVAGLKRITVTSAAEIMTLLEEGNHRRKTDSTDANATSSRSHAVLEILVRRQPRNQVRSQVLLGKLSLVDLAGSERAAETNNNGQKLRDGANINKSLLALANCINALGKQQKTGVAYVPYRNSKLTRLLKDSLSGNSRTAMVATISAAADQYHHSVNTLKYADRAKEIKTHVVQNVGSVERHVADYKSIIDNLQSEVQQLRGMLADRAPVPASLSAGSAAAAGAPGGAGSASASSAASPGVSSLEADALAWIDGLVQEVNDNIEERINLQKALFELEDINVCNQYELQNLEDMLCSTEVHLDAPDRAEAEERRQVLREEVAENSSAAERYRADIAANESTRREIQARIETAIQSNSNANFLKVLSTFRIQAVRLQELKFQMAVRDQIISEQRDVISNLWRILQATGLSKDQITDLARHEGILMQGFMREEGDGPPTVGAGQLAALTASLGTPPSPMALPGAPPAVQQSLMGGKARYRYRFWQQRMAGQQSMAGAALSRGNSLGTHDHGAAKHAAFKGHPPSAGPLSATRGGARSPSPLRQSYPHAPAAAAAKAAGHEGQPQQKQQQKQQQQHQHQQPSPRPVPHQPAVRVAPAKVTHLLGATNRSPSRSPAGSPEPGAAPSKATQAGPGSKGPSPSRTRVQLPPAAGHAAAPSSSSHGDHAAHGPSHGPLATLRQARQAARAQGQDSGWGEPAGAALTAAAKQQQLVAAYGQPPGSVQDKLARLKTQRLGGSSHVPSASVSAEPSGASLDLPHPSAHKQGGTGTPAVARSWNSSPIRQQESAWGAGAGKGAGHGSTHSAAAAGAGGVQRSGHSFTGPASTAKPGSLSAASGVARGGAGGHGAAKGHHAGKGVEPAALPNIAEGNGKLAELRRKQLQHLVQVANRSAAEH